MYVFHSAFPQIIGAIVKQSSAVLSVRDVTLMLHESLEVL